MQRLIFSFFYGEGRSCLELLWMQSIIVPTNAKLERLVMYLLVFCNVHR